MVSHTNPWRRPGVRLALAGPLVAVLAWFSTAGCGETVELGDLPALEERGEIRFLAPTPTEVELLPRRGHALDRERELARDFAEELGLDARFVIVRRHDELIPALLAGRGDLIVSNLSDTDARRSQILFSAPLERVSEQVVARRDDPAIRDLDDLETRRVFVRRSSSFWDSLAELRARHPGIEAVEAPEDLTTEEILYRVSTGEFDTTIADSNIASEVLAYLPELDVALELGIERDIAWGLRPDATRLKAALDEFLANRPVAPRAATRYREDLPGLRKRRVLRVLTLNTPTTYFVWRGKLMGFEYELAERFARDLGLRLEVVVAPTRTALFSWLEEGRGDLIAASMTETPERVANGFAFSHPYLQVQEMLVTRARGRAPETLDDLDGRRVYAQRSTSHWSTLEALREAGAGFELNLAPESLSTREILDRVADGRYDLTVLDSHVLDLEKTWRDDVRGVFPLGESQRIGWVVRRGDGALLAAIDDFLRREYRSTFYNIVFRRYFEDSKTASSKIPERASLSGEISPFDDLVRRYADEYGFDWRLIVAQMYEESRFDPEARSFAGARGLLQMLPSTAREQGFDDIEDPEQGIHAGVKYLRTLYDRFEGEVAERDRAWFALASYNAGRGRVIDARRLARRLGLDARRWFGHVEKAMPLLSREEYFQHSRYGYCRCTEPVAYVRNIRNRYRAYRGVAAAARTGWSDVARQRARLASATLRAARMRQAPASQSISSPSGP